jgi:hypothetical protein
MSKSEKKWVVTRIKGSSAHAYGTVRAPTAEAAIRQVIETSQITDPEQLKRLAARPAP